MAIEYITHFSEIETLEGRYVIIDYSRRGDYTYSEYGTQLLDAVLYRHVGEDEEEVGQEMEIATIDLNTKAEMLDGKDHDYRFLSGQEIEDGIIAYIGTIWDFLTPDMTEDEIRKLVVDDMSQMDEDERALTAATLDEIVEEAVEEVRDKREDYIAAYIDTIDDDLTPDMTEDEIKELVVGDMSQMDEDEKALITKLLDEIVEEAAEKVRSYKRRRETK